MRQPGGIRVRAASTEDLAALLRCDPYSETNLERQGLIADAIAGGQCYVAERSGAALGFVLLTGGFFRHAFVPLLAVAPEFRRQGVGLALLKAAIASCGTAKLFTSTNSSNLGAQKLLSRAGFVRSGVVENLDVGDPELIYFIGTEDGAMLRVFTDAESTSVVAAQVRAMNLTSAQLEQLRGMVDMLLTDTMYTLLLGLDGEASIGGVQQRYDLRSESGTVISGKIEEEAWRQFHGAT